MMRVCGTLASVVFGLSLVSTTAARANPAATVPSGADPGKPISFHFGLDYDYELDKATITRELTGGDQDPLDGTLRRPDLEFRQSRHLLIPRLDIGLAPDTWLSFALPVTIAQSRQLSLASGVDRSQSSTLLDALLPPEGFDARDPGTPPPGDLIFRGEKRSGIDQVHVGLNFAMFNQHRDDTKPTWKIGGELRLAAGRIMTFDPRNPSETTGVSTGVHELRLWTTVDRQFRWNEAWFELFWQTPIWTRDRSLFADPGFGSRSVKPSQQAGVAFGLETFVMNDRANNHKISVDIGSRVVGHFEGRAYTEMWEVFAYAGDPRGGGPLILDGDPATDGVQPLRHPGISNVENYLETAAQVAVRAAVGPRIRFAALAKLAWKTDHVISFADAGIDLPHCEGAAMTSCETAIDNIVTPGTREVNPLHVPRIDLVGHRYRSEDNFGLVLGIESQVLW
ncbi:MAG: hypothetical protein AB7P03_18710 [Kofleriaceae bacterium]